MARGRLITIEGLDGAGKTTLASSLAESLRSRALDVQLLREPGGVRVSEMVRAMVMDPGLRIGNRAEALLYAAARAQLVEEALAPLLERGALVLLDRFVDSSLAYQGGGRGLGIEPVRLINAFATAGLTPDLTLLLSLDPALGRERSEGRRAPPDRLELESDGFFARIADAYAQLAAAEPERFVVIDAARPPAAVLAAAEAAIARLL
jgi:dTMP kinase